MADFDVRSLASALDIVSYEYCSGRTDIRSYGLLLVDLRNLAYQSLDPKVHLLFIPAVSAALEAIEFSAPAAIRVSMRDRRRSDLTLCETLLSRTGYVTACGLINMSAASAVAWQHDIAEADVLSAIAKTIGARLRKTDTLRGVSRHRVFVTLRHPLPQATLRLLQERLESCMVLEVAGHSSAVCLRAVFRNASDPSSGFLLQQLERDLTRSTKEGGR